MLGPTQSAADPILWPKGKPAYVAEPPEPLPRLPRPVLLIPGGTSIKYGLPDIIHYLTAGGNNAFGGSYSVTDPDSVDAKANVFCLRYSTPFGSFGHNAEEIHQAIEDIKRLTHSNEIDVVASCKGAVETRQFVSYEDHPGIRNLVLMVPPNHGLPISGEIARALSRLTEKLHLPLGKLAPFPLTKDACVGLASFSPDWRLGLIHNNRLLERLNSPQNLQHESQVLNSITVLGGEGRRLLDGTLGPGLPFKLMRGDHLVPNWSAWLPHARNYFYDGDRATHNRVKSHPQALAKLGETLLSDGHPGADTHMVTKQPSVNSVLRRSTAWVAAFAGRTWMAVHAVMGGTLGPIGMGLGAFGAGLAVLDGTRQVVDAWRHPEEGRVKPLLSALGKLAQAGGVGAAMAGCGPLAAGLIGGGLLLSTFTT